MLNIKKEQNEERKKNTEIKKTKLAGSKPNNKK